MLDQIEVAAENGSKVANKSRRNLFKLAAAGSVASLITLEQNEALGAEVLPPPIIYPSSPPVVSWQESIPV